MTRRPDSSSTNTCTESKKKGTFFFELFFVAASVTESQELKGRLLSALSQVSQAHAQSLRASFSIFGWSGSYSMNFKKSNNRRMGGRVLPQAKKRWNRSGFLESPVMQAGSLRGNTVSFFPHEAVRHSSTVCYW